MPRGGGHFSVAANDSVGLARYLGVDEKSLDEATKYFPDPANELEAFANYIRWLAKHLAKLASHFSGFTDHSDERVHHLDEPVDPSSLVICA